MTGAQLYTNTGYFIQPHDVILNRLNFWHENGGNKVFYDAAEFEKALSTFQDVPIVFAKRHPTKIGILPLDEALKEVDGKVIGHPSNIQVNNMGSPDLSGGLTIEDPEVDELIKQGNAYISTAFTGSLSTEGKLTGVTGNHILVYPADSGPYPNDPAALFLNQSPNPGLANPTLPTTRGKKTMTTEPKNETDPAQVLIANQSVKIEEQAVLIANQKTQLEEKDKELSKKDELILNQSKEIDGYKAKLQAIKDAEKAKERELLLNQYAAGVQEQFKSRMGELDDPDTAIGLILAMNQAQAKIPPVEVKTAEGKQHFANQSPNAKEEEEAEAAWVASNMRF